MQNAQERLQVHLENCRVCRERYGRWDYCSRAFAIASAMSYKVA